MNEMKNSYRQGSLYREVWSPESNCVVKQSLPAPPLTRSIKAALFLAKFIGAAIAVGLAAMLVYMAAGLWTWVGALWSSSAFQVGSLFELACRDPVVMAYVAMAYMALVPLCWGICAGIRNAMFGWR